MTTEKIQHTMEDAPGSVLLSDGSRHEIRGTLAQSEDGIVMYAFKPSEVLEAMIDIENARLETHLGKLRDAQRMLCKAKDKRSRKQRRASNE